MLCSYLQPSSWRGTEIDDAAGGGEEVVFSIELDKFERRSSSVSLFSVNGISLLYLCDNMHDWWRGVGALLAKRRKKRTLRVDTIYRDDLRCTTVSQLYKGLRTMGAAVASGYTAPGAGLKKN